MTEEEFYKLKTGDVVEYNGRKFVFDFSNISSNTFRGQAWFLIERDFRFNIFKNGNIWTNNYTLSDDKTLGNLKLISKNSLEERIKEKELELETLKKELSELNRNKMFENLDPNTIYKVVHDGFIEIGFMREFYRDSYRISNVFGKVGDMIPKECITEIIPLNEATETYKKLKNLLENA